MNRQRGFTLIELVAVIIIISVASVPLFGLFSQASSKLLVNEYIQTAAQLAQERAELVLGWRRNLGFSAPQLATGTNNEVLAGNYTGYTRNTTISSPPSGPGCPGGATCKEVAIGVSHNGNNYALVTFLMVDY